MVSINFVCNLSCTSFSSSNAHRRNSCLGKVMNHEWLSFRTSVCVFSLEKGGFAHDLIMINHDLMCYILLLGVADLRWWLDGIIRILALVVGFLVLTSIHNR